MQRLTPRQCENLDLLYQGQSYKLMARLSSVSDNAVRRHGQGIFILFDVGSRAEVAATR